MKHKAALLAAFFVLPVLVFASGDVDKSAESNGVARMAEALIEKLPMEKVDRAAGFFGPVVKKYLPVMHAFREEYETSNDKAAVIVKYMPKLEAALEDAKAMPVPPRYEAEKADYIRIASSVVSSLRFLCKLKNGKK
jgi:hypothetical protein